MIKSSAYTGASAATKVGFPALFRSRHDGSVVLFTHDSVGLEIMGRGGSVGNYMTRWVRCQDTSRWEPLKPGDSVTLTVE